MIRSAGDILGAYEVRSLLGKGGMGEVYLAHDTKLGRDVAIKTLPAEFARAPERLARFQREARMLAALNHPNIAAIYGLEESAGDTFLVLELVEGDTLAERLKRTGTLPLADALKIAGQLAEALEAAHAKGITHRDIKPANIKMTSEDRVKVLDFGLAKAIRGERESTDLSQALTLTLGTDAGTILGTPTYMSPEQARGQMVDHRTDIWAFGCVLYEMLSGERAFRGQTLPDVIGAVMGQEPDWNALPRATPERIRDLLRRCLMKDRGERPHSIAEASEVIALVQAGSHGISRRRVAMSAGAAAAVALGLAVAINIGGLRDRLASGSRMTRSIAVLPLANLSGDPNQEYFSDGITESLISDLARIGALKVISRTSAMTYKGSKKPLREIARELNVETVIEGSAVRAGDRIRIRVQLIDAKTDQPLWAETYDRDFADVLVLQSEVARTVAQQVRAQLTPQEQTRLASARPVNPEAHNAYLQGAFFAQRTTRQDLDTAQRYFELALEKDPDYALAHSGLSWVWIARRQLNFISKQEADVKVAASAEKALALDSGLAQVHNTLGLMKGWVRWDFPGAEASFRRAIELDPNYPDARVWYARLLNILMRPAEAMPQLERALEVDPRNTLFRIVYAQELNHVRRYDEALTQARQILAVDPTQQQAIGAMREALLAKGLVREALEINLRRNPAKAKGEVAQIVQRGIDQGKYREAARDAAAFIEDRWRSGAMPVPVGIPFYYTAAGQPDKLLEFLEWAIENDSGVLEGVRAAARDFPQLERNPRYQAILRRLGLP